MSLKDFILAKLQQAIPSNTVLSNPNTNFSDRTITYKNNSIVSNGKPLSFNIFYDTIIKFEGKTIDRDDLEKYNPTYKNPDCNVATFFLVTEEMGIATLITPPPVVINNIQTRAKTQATL